MIKELLSTGISLGLLITLQAQTPMSLHDILTTVEKNNPGLKMYESEARAINEAAKGAYSWMPPEGGAGLFMTPYNTKEIKADKAMMKEGMGFFMISAQQMFPNRKKQDAEAAWMRSMSKVETEKRNVVLNELLYAAKKNYYEWVLLLKKQSVLDEGSRILDFMIKSAEIRYKNGLGKISAYYKAKAALANIENMKLMLENDMRQKRILLNNLMYRKTDQPLAVDTLYTWKDFPASMLDSVSLISRRSDIQVLQRNIEVNNLQRNAELAKLKPEFGIRYDHMIGLSTQPSQFTVMGMVKLPLAKWSSKMNKAKAESLVWQNESLRSQQQMILNEAAGMAGSAKAELETKKKQMRLYETQIVPALRKNFQTMQLGYEQNTEELFELFDAWEALNMTQLEYLDQIKTALLLQAELEKVLEIK
ncbi:TolC family protein [Niastella caeni]|uniref:TolC family protein n=1 Tax=Niastella caeni TaxID=2569763 RepID=A0A4V4H0J9_9BACT|nr:TolC family protein [Niastella caeni]THU36866.1 TolC family protein [Niastella caeni]